MKSFYITLDNKVTVWTRITGSVEAETMKDAQAQMLVYHNGDNNEIDAEYEYLTETEEDLGVIDFIEELCYEEK